MGDIFLKLMNMSITAGWLVLAVIGVRFLFRKMPKWICCLLWGVVAIRLLLPFSIESVFSLQPSAEPIQKSTVVEGEIRPYVPAVASSLPVVENTVNPILQEAFSYEETDSVAPLQVATGIAGYVWLVGMSGLLLFAISSTLRLKNMVREAVCYQENVFLCDAVKTPFILGIIRPRIYLPSTLSEEEIEYILAHERAHLQRLDHFWKPIGYLLLCVYWFNPVLFIAYILLCKDIELACDEKVIRDMSFSDKKDYSRVLLSCATQRRFVLSCPLAFGEVGVKDRVKTVLNHKKAALGITILAILVCIVVAACFLTNPAKEYQIRITIPAGGLSDFYYSDEEISPKRNTFIVANGDGLGDTEVILLPIEVSEENAYDESQYLTPGMPVKMEAEKGAWFKIGVRMQNPSAKDMKVYVTVRNVDVRISSCENGEENSEENKKNESAEAKVTTDEISAGNPIIISDSEGQLPDANDPEVFEELKRVVDTVGLQNAYPWNNTVEFKSNADVLIKMAEDETGCFQIYGIMSEKYGAYGLLLSDRTTGEEKQSFAYVPWYYSGSDSEQPVLESDGTGNYVFSYTSKTEDGGYRECTLVCGDHIDYLGTESEQIGSDTRMVRVDGQLYYDTGIISPVWGRCGVMDGEITSSVQHGKPTEDNQSNFGHGFGYQRGLEKGTIEIPIKEQWYIFAVESAKKGLEENVLPRCRYLGNDKQEAAIYEYFEKRTMVNSYEEVTIPAFVILLSEATNDGRIKVYGNFWRFNYVRNGEILECVGGSECPGVIYLKKDGEGYEVDKFDEVGVGSDYSKDIKKICQGNKELEQSYFNSADVRKSPLKEVRHSAITSYVLENGLSITAYRDYGWDAIPLAQPDNPLPLGEEFHEPVNQLADVTMFMEKYKDWEGAVEISNHSGKELETGEDCDIQVEVDGKWYSLEQLYDGLWNEVSYKLPDGETTIININWSSLYGKLPAGSYRIVKRITDYHAPGDYDTYYLAKEFVISVPSRT